MELSNLPRDLMEVILSKLPVRSLRAIQLTCKEWNLLFKTGSVAEKHISEEDAEARESMVLMMMDYKVYLMDIDLHWIHSSSIKRKGKLISFDGIDYLVGNITKIYPCDGLLLCLMNGENKRLVVWNPFSGQSRWIEPKNSYDRSKYDYAFGYEKKKNRSSRIHKILRFFDDHKKSRSEIYVLKTNSWWVRDMTPPDWGLCSFQCSVSLKGNAYWIAYEKTKIVTFNRETGFDEERRFLICFDFTREIFGPLLRLPTNAGIMVLSSVGEEQLTLLTGYTSELVIWVTSNIEPKRASWHKLFSTVHTPLRVRNITGVSVFTDEEEKKTAVLIEKTQDYKSRHIAHIIRENKYWRQVDLQVTADKSCHPILVHIKRSKRKHIIFD